MDFFIGVYLFGVRSFWVCKIVSLIEQPHKMRVIKIRYTSTVARVIPHTPYQQQHPFSRGFINPGECYRREGELRGQWPPPFGRRALRVRAHGLLQSDDRVSSTAKSAGRRGLAASSLNSPSHPQHTQAFNACGWYRYEGETEPKVTPRPKVFAVGETGRTREARRPGGAAFGLNSPCRR